MTFPPLRLNTKVYLTLLISALLVIAMLAFSYIRISQISGSLERLNELNRKLQSFVTLGTQIEELKRHTLNYTLVGDAASADAAETIYIEMQTQLTLPLGGEMEPFQPIIDALNRHLQSYHGDFRGMLRERPIQTRLRDTLRSDAASVEEEIERLRTRERNAKTDSAYLRILTLLLRTEKGAFRYFETLDRSHAESARQAIAETFKILEALQSGKAGGHKVDVAALKKQLEAYRQTTTRVLQHFRAYLMLDVVMAGEAHEMLHYARKLREAATERSDRVTRSLHDLTRLLRTTMLLGAVTLMAVMLLSSWLIIRIFVTPLREMTRTFDALTEGSEDVQISDYVLDDDIGRLTRAARSFEEKNVQTRHLLEKTEALAQHLEERVDEEVRKQREQEQVLIQQSKLAAMGEMISAIAHQWRQPLNAIALYLQDLVSAERGGELTREYLKESVSMTMEQINHMSRTIDDFRHFFKPTSEDEAFDIEDAVEESLQLFSAQLKNNEIAVNLDTVPEADTTITGNSNHLRQVILNLLSNAIDAIKERKERQPGKYLGQISLQIEAMPDRFRITVEDNGAGIEPGAVEHVFEPYFTTKEQGKGSGIGLYMSRTILQNYFGATLNLIPLEEGVRAEVLMPRSHTRKGKRNDDAS